MAETVQVYYGLDKVFDVKIEDLWEILAEKFESMAFFGFKESDVTHRGEIGKVGLTRIFVFNGVKSEEVLVAKEPTTHCMTYTCPVAGAPFNSSYISTIKMDKVDDNKTRVRWWANMQVESKMKVDCQKAMDGCPGFFMSCIEKFAASKK